MADQMAFPDRDERMDVRMENDNGALVRVIADAGTPPNQKSDGKSMSAKRKERERVRVSRACDRCKGKKIRCTGKKPCALCDRLGLPCEFNARYTRGKLPEIEMIEGQAQPPAPRNSISSVSPTLYTPKQNPPTSAPAISTFQNPEMPLGKDAPLETLRTGSRHHLDDENPESAAQSSRNSPEPSQTDLQGHYVGPSSGVSFLLRAQKRLHKIVSLSSNSSIFTFGDSPLPEFDSSFFVLPPKERARLLVARYFDFAVPTHRYLHRPTVEGWVEELYGNLGTLRDRSGERGKRAVTFMVFAQASEYMKKDDDTQEVDCSARYFQAAEHQLRSETGSIRLASVQARLAQCFYLLSESRINHCWSLFGTTAHLILALGIHRKTRRREAANYDLIDIECRKRVFWAAYTLDNYLSAALGRPRTFHDDDIDQDLPAMVQDSELTASQILPSPNKSQSIMLAPIYHAKLAQIISGILKDMYGIRPFRPEVRDGFARKHTLDLREWRHGIAHFIDVDSSLLNPLFQRQSNSLHLAYAHACLLVHRPFLLSNFADLTRRNPLSRHSASQIRTSESVSECLKAASSIVNIVNDMFEGGRYFRAFWFTHYFAFSAVVVLYIYVIQQRSAPRDTWRRYFDMAEKCQRQISNKGSKDSFAQRYSIVLEELRVEAMKQTVNAPLNETVGVVRAHPLDSEVQERERDQDTEVAHTILRLSDNSHHQEPYSISIEAPSIQRHDPSSTSISRSQSVSQGQPPHTTAFDSYEHNHISPATHGLGPNHANLNPNHGINSLNFPGTSPASLSSLMGDGTGWGEFDSFVTAGVGGFEGNYFGNLGVEMGVGGVAGVGGGRWDFGILGGEGGVGGA